MHQQETSIRWVDPLMRMTTSPLSTRVPSGTRPVIVGSAPTMKKATAATPRPATTPKNWRNPEHRFAASIGGDRRATGRVVHLGIRQVLAKRAGDDLPDRLGVEPGGGQLVEQGGRDVGQAGHEGSLSRSEAGGTAGRRAPARPRPE